jgi:hypothetical protein
MTGGTPGGTRPSPVQPTRSHSVTGRECPLAAPDAASLVIEGDRARLSTTDRPAPIRIENLGS